MQGAALVAPAASLRPTSPSACPTARCSCRSRPSASSSCAPTMTEQATLPPHGRVAGPDHPRPERQRRRAILGRRPPVAAALGLFPRLGTPVQQGRRARLRDAAGPGGRRLGHAPAPGRARPADRHRRAPGRRAIETLATTGAVAQTQLDDARRRAEGPAGPPRRPRQDPARAGGPGGARRRGRRAGHRGAGQMAPPGAMVFQIVDPTRLWVEALSFDALTAAQDATARLADGRSLDARLSGRRARRPQPGHPGPVRGRRATPPACGSGSSSPCSPAPTPSRPGSPCRARPSCAPATGRTSSTSTSRAERFEAAAGPGRAPRRRPRARRRGRRAGQARRHAGRRTPRSGPLRGAPCSRSSSRSRCATGCSSSRIAAVLVLYGAFTVDASCRSTSSPTSTGRPSPS